MKNSVVLSMVLVASLSAKSTDIYIHAKDVRVTAMSSKRLKEKKKENFNSRDVYNIAKVKKSIYDRR